MTVDKILYVNKNQLVIYYTDGRMFTIYTDNSTALELLKRLGLAA